MAFLKDNKYIRLLEDGSFKVYSSAEKRAQHKNATSSEVILAKYQELRADLNTQLTQIVLDAGYTQEDIANPDLHDILIVLPGIQNLVKELEELNDELYEYESDLSNEQGAKHDFPLIAKFYPDVKDSIPEIIEGANIGIWKSSKLADMYEEAKAKHRFGETEDC